MKYLTDFGDSAVLLPLSAAVFIWLLVMRPARSAAWWIGALIFCGAVTVVLKILFFACPPALDISSPSGHTSFSLLAYGGVAGIVAVERQSPWERTAIILSAIGLVASIGISRVVLGMHSEPEIIIGFAIGAAALAIFGFGYLRLGGSGRTITPLLIGVTLILTVFHGSKLNPENKLHELGGWLDFRSLVCPVAEPLPRKVMAAR
jgi:membrane-associated phospholipid phosphatase